MRALILLPALLLVACGTEPDPPASVTVAPSTATVEIGESTVFTFSAADATGAVLTGRTAVWASSDPTIATVAATGGGATVTGVGGGTASISATVEGVTGTASVSVRPLATGSWSGSGTQGSQTLFVAVTLTESASALTGSGTVNFEGQPPDAMTITGTRTGTSITVAITVSGFDPFTFAGTYDGSTMTGTINGSGFTDFPMMLVRVGS